MPSGCPTPFRAVIPPPAESVGCLVVHCGVPLWKLPLTEGSRLTQEHTPSFGGTLRQIPEFRGLAPLPHFRTLRRALSALELPVGLTEASVVTASQFNSSLRPVLHPLLLDTWWTLMKLLRANLPQRLLALDADLDSSWIVFLFSTSQDVLTMKFASVGGRGPGRVLRASSVLDLSGALSLQNRVEGGGWPLHWPKQAPGNLILLPLCGLI